MIKKIKKKPVIVKKEIKKESDPNLKKIRIKIIGVGGGGGNIVSELSKKLKDFSAQKVDFLAVNTDSQALSSLPKKLKTFSFWKQPNQGIGNWKKF